MGKDHIHRHAKRASDDADQLTRPVIMLQIVVFFCAIGLAKQRLHTLRRAKEYRHRKRGQIRNDCESTDANIAVGRHQRMVHAKRGDWCGKLGDTLRKTSENNLAEKLPQG